MSDVRAKYVPPSVKETAFNCPHCGALARQTWYGCLVEESPSHPPPVVMDDAFVETVRMLHREGKSPSISVEFAENVFEKGFRRGEKRVSWGVGLQDDTRCDGAAEPTRQI